MQHTKFNFLNQKTPYKIKEFFGLNKTDLTGKNQIIPF